MIEPEREQFLQRLALFSDLDTGELRALAEVVQVVQFPTSALIFREGEAGDCAYVVVRGSVQVFAIDRNGDEVGPSAAQRTRPRRRAVVVARPLRPSQRESSRE